MKILLFPFILVIKLIEFILKLTGRFLAVGIGLTLIALGVIISLTIVGAVVGIPIGLFGALLLVRGLF